MTIFIIRRLVQGFFVAVAASLLIYTVLIVSPGGPADQIRRWQFENPDAEVSPHFIQHLYELYGLDKPWPLNYLSWLFDPADTLDFNPNLGRDVPKGIDIPIGPFRLQGSGVLTGDLGESINLQPDTTVVEMLGQRLPITLALTITAQLFAILVAFPVGIISAVRQYSKLDYTVTTISFFGLSMPTFWLGLMLIIVFAVLAKQAHAVNGWEWLPYLPPGNAWDVEQQHNIANRAWHLVLPVVTLSFVSVAGLSRFVRSSMLEVLRQDYVRTAWAKGLSQRVVILKHALRNALIPVITIVTLGLPGLVEGAIITETIFAYAGMGQLYLNAILQFDITLAMGFLIIVTGLIVLSNILADVLYAVVDPRIHYS